MAASKKTEETAAASETAAAEEDLVAKATREAIDARGGLPGKTIPGQARAATAVAPATTEKPAPARTRKPKDPMAQGTQIAREIVTEEMQVRQLRVEASRKGLDPNKLPLPVQSVRARHRRTDPTEIRDSQGKLMEFPGMVTRWVRTVDSQGRPTMARVAEFESYGYTCPLDPHTNEPIKKDVTVAMIGPPEAYAERMIDRMPQDALVPDQSVQKMIEMAEMVNKAYGHPVGSVVRERAHGSEARMETFYPSGSGGERLPEAEILTV